MCLLLTAFKGTHNSSYQIIKDCENDKLIFTNSYTGIDSDLEEYDLSPYTGAFMFGIDTRLKDKIRIEPKAVLNGDIQKTAYDTKDFAESMKDYGLQATVAERATSYLCNYAYYRVLEIMNGRAIFIHIPPERYLTETMQHRMRNVIEAISDLL